MARAISARAWLRPAHCPEAGRRAASWRPVSWAHERPQRPSRIAPELCSGGARRARHRPKRAPMLRSLLSGPLASYWRLPRVGPAASSGGIARAPVDHAERRHRHRIARWYQTCVRSMLNAAVVARECLSIMRSLSMIWRLEHDCTRLRGRLAHMLAPPPGGSASSRLLVPGIAGYMNACSSRVTSGRGMAVAVPAGRGTARRKRPFRAVLLGRQLARYWRLSRAGRRCRRRCRWSHGRLLVVALCAERRLRHRIARCCQTCVRSL